MGDIIGLKRDSKALQSNEFDLLVVGAGIFGACAAWEAALRGYNVALVEQNDFGSGVSANSYKIIHGGIRYIQHLDVARVRSSCRERSALLRIAPHLVHPLPIAIPTYGYGMSGKPVLSAGMYLYDLITADRNSGITDDERRISWARLLGRNDVLDLFPGLDSRNLTGATQFSDAQMYNPPRLVLAFLQSAASKGAIVCNYAEVSGYDVSGNGVKCAYVRDKLSGETFPVRAKVVLNAAGPWTDSLLENQPELGGSVPGVYSRDACFVVPRKFDHDISLAIMGQTRDPDAVMSRPARHLFVVPWRNYSLVGTWHKIVAATPDAIGIDRDEVAEFIEEVHAAYPDLDLSTGEVKMCNWGLVPFGEEQKCAENLSYGKRSILIDHARNSGPENMISLVGIRYTMGRGDARWAMESVARKLGDDRKAPASDQIPLYGADFSSFASLCQEISTQLPDGLAGEVALALAHNHGSNASALISTNNCDVVTSIGDSHVLAAEVKNAIENEMATSLSDIVFRRTDLASGGSPGSSTLKECADLTAKWLGLSDSEIQRQLAAVEARIPGWGQAGN